MSSCEAERSTRGARPHMERGVLSQDVDTTPFVILRIDLRIPYDIYSNTHINVMTTAVRTYDVCGYFGYCDRTWYVLVVVFVSHAAVMSNHTWYLVHFVSPPL